MTSKQAWEQFTTTGRIQDYMVYRSLLQMETLPGLLGEAPASDGGEQSAAAGGSGHSPAQRERGIQMLMSARG